MTVLESLIKDLEKLPPEKLVEVARFVHQIEPERAAKRLAALESTAGCMVDVEVPCSRTR